MGKGGMRNGAGRPSYKAKAEHMQRIVVAQWHRGDYLRAGCSFTWSWHRGGDPSGSIGVQVHSDDALSLQYTVGAGAETRDASQRIGIARTPCHFGKTRPWFACPCCHKRAGVLYLRWGRFACRHCNKVAYSSQSGDVMDRTWRKQSKLEARLGDHWARPKGMRHKTHDRLIDALHDCELRRDHAFCATAMRLFGDRFLL